MPSRHPGNTQLFLPAMVGFHDNTRYLLTSPGSRVRLSCERSTPTPPVCRLSFAPKAVLHEAVKLTAAPAILYTATQMMTHIPRACRAFRNITVTMAESPASQLQQGWRGSRPKGGDDGSPPMLVPRVSPAGAASPAVAAGPRVAVGREPVVLDPALGDRRAGPGHAGYARS